MKSLSVTIQMKATEQYFPMALFIMLYKVVLTFESVDELLSSTFQSYCLLCCKRYRFKLLSLWMKFSNV